jgi:hypothetical protein
MGLMASLEEFIDRLRIKLFDFEMLTRLMVPLMFAFFAARSVSSFNAPCANFNAFSNRH